MAVNGSNEDSAVRAGAQFATTHWSTVLRAVDSASPEAPEALEKLCRQYWFPLYAFVRRKGYSPEDAKDLTQEFFRQLLGRHRLHLADRRRGRFRSFLLSSLNHFLVNEWDRVRAAKRGGDLVFVAWDDKVVEDRLTSALAAELTPDQVFDQQWAMTLLERVLTQLRAECCEADKEPLFEQAKAFLTGEQDRGGYGSSAAALGMSEGALKMAVSRMRRRYGQLLRQEIAQTVSTPAQLEEEWSDLIAALRRASL
jgi:DNA-directed RNA polymerase specialized sigma24 family protein